MFQFHTDYIKTLGNKKFNKKNQLDHPTHATIKYSLFIDDAGAGDEEMYGLDSTGIVVAELRAIGAGPSDADSEIGEPEFCDTG